MIWLFSRPCHAPLSVHIDPCHARLIVLTTPCHGPMVRSGDQLSMPCHGPHIEMPYTSAAKLVFVQINQLKKIADKSKLNEDKTHDKTKINQRSHYAPDGLLVPIPSPAGHHALLP